MTQPFLPKDRFSASIPVLGVRSGGSHVLNVAASTATNTVPFKSSVITLQTTEDILYEPATTSAGVTVSAGSHFLAKGASLDLSTLDPDTGGLTKRYISFKRGSQDGTLYISERE